MEASRELYSVRRLYENTEQPVGYRDYIDLVEVPGNHGIRINVGGSVFTMPIRAWHKLANDKLADAYHVKEIP